MICFIFFFLANISDPGTEQNNPPRVVGTVDLTDDKSKSYTLKKTSTFYNGETVSFFFPNRFWVDN